MGDQKCVETAFKGTDHLLCCRRRRSTSLYREAGMHWKQGRCPPPHLTQTKMEAVCNS